MPIDIKQKLNEVSQRPSDINEHIMTLYALAKECDTILECGVRTIVSSWAFVNGLVDRPTTAQKILNCSDLNNSPNAPMLATA